MNLQKLISIIIFSVLLSSYGFSQSNNELKSSIEELVFSSNADIGVSIIEPETNNIIAINGDNFYPMLSTFKFPIALAILHKVETGELSINQELLVKNEELFENTWSPFKKEFPKGNNTISLEAALKWMIVYSDNNITDILLRLVGGTEYVEQFINDENFNIKNSEKEMHKDWEAQFKNKVTPNAYSKLLKSFTEEKILNKTNTEWLYQAMTNSTTGIKRLKGKLPNVIIAQRAGTSFTNSEGITGAINNVGIIELPNNKKIYISVFIHNTSEGFEKGEKLIASIAKVTYDYHSKK
jgi:beta-lactamase class A